MMNQEAIKAKEDTKNIKLKLKYTNLKDKKEKKLKYDHKKIESIIENFLRKYEIDAQVEKFIESKFLDELDKNEIYKNLDILLSSSSNKKKNYQPQLKYETFLEIKTFVEKLIKESIQKELNEIENKYDTDEISDEEYIMYQEIYNNFNDEIELTMFQHGINRLTLVAFHYYLKVLEKFAKIFLQEKGITNIKRAKNSLELFLNDLYIIISKNPELTRFLLTLKSLIEQWLVKYNNKTKIGEFYYDILMITPDQIVERILKYLLFTAIKNKNPLTLRAIFSSYLTLIHQNLFSFYATNLSKVKVGFFKQLEGLFTENFSLIFENKDLNHNFNKFIYDMMLMIYSIKHKKVFKDDYFFMNDAFIQQFFEPNYFDFIRSYNDNFSIVDHSFLYNTVLKFTNNSFIEESYWHKINSKFFKNNSKKKYQVYIKEKLNEKLFDYFYNFINDREAVDEILSLVAKDLSIKLNFLFFVDKNFKLISKQPYFNENYFLKKIDNLIDILSRKILNHEYNENEKNKES